MLCEIYSLMSVIYTYSRFRTSNLHPTHTLFLFVPDIHPYDQSSSMLPLFSYLRLVYFPTPLGQCDSPVTMIKAASTDRNNNTHAAAAFLKGEYNTVGAAASSENYDHGQVVKLIKEWENHRVGLDLREVPCESVGIIFPGDKLECINNVKGNFKRKMLAVEIVAALILDKTTRAPPHQQKRSWTLWTSQSHLR